MVTYLVLTICLNGTSPCEYRKLDLYQSKVYCEKSGIMEAAKAAATFPEGYTITKWDCK
jgi:hypothetical protein